jgi:hypothetical protein
MVESTWTAGFGFRADRAEDCVEPVERPLAGDGRKPIEHSGGERVLEALDAAPGPAAFFGELHARRPSIGRIRQASDQPGGLEAAKISSKSAGRDPEECPQLAEAESSFAAEGFEGRRLGHRHPAALDVGTLRDREAAQEGCQQAPEAFDLLAHDGCIIQHDGCRIQVNIFEQP